MRTAGSWANGLTSRSLTALPLMVLPRLSTTSPACFGHLRVSLHSLLPRLTSRLRSAFGSATEFLSSLFQSTGVRRQNESERSGSFSPKANFPHLTTTSPETVAFQTRLG